MAPGSVPLNLKWLPSKLKLKSQLQTNKNKNSNNIIERVQLPEKTCNSRVLILGGTGRVGGSTAIALSNLCPDLRILVAGRNREKGEALVGKLGGNSGFSHVDIDDQDSLQTSLKDVDLVVHAAGPFQQAEKCSVLEAAINTKTAYVDVCDDTSYAWRTKSFMSKALAANVPAITTGGIYPGVSNVMAAELVRAAESEGEHKPESLRFSYYTAGTGGAGPTILATSFLLLGEEVVAYSKGEKVKRKPYSGMLNVDFGKGIGRRDVYLLNLPEVRSAYEILGVPTVSARFGTAPFFWNWGMEAMTKLFPPVFFQIISAIANSTHGNILSIQSTTPQKLAHANNKEFLRDRSKVRRLVELFDPIVRAIDGIAGERVSMRVDLECSSGRSTVGIFSHRKLSVSVGFATAAFALAILEGSTQPGVWFPEEPQGLAVEAREILLKRASQETLNFVMNRSPWMIETDPKELGLGIYI